ncbi:MoxR-like ATPase [Psychromonas ingrahamii 37]|uniref:MoxR-like ATPase n=1 Tax=Psychromonas ingrahamii (strain DSM 17664 / CCUG 51855 / 37) TaxID=357804 RepID=A1SX92_PSYIN|nr:MoxR family ATPase [Psychromonas ingrahamii]ABM04107.1 MoxR-like ATPase [Psychromonas ingrahamii 37]
MHNKIANILKQLNHILLGKEDQIKLALVCLLADGHLLIEDLPGMGKTTLASALAKTLGLDYQRVQFTSDMLPADILGVSIFDSNKKQFNFHKGPIFSQVLLADEINRASPKTQSALLEAMEEKQISLDSQTYALPTPFFVIATQNPTDQAGTFPLPESQLDRFMMRIELGFPNMDAELKMLKAHVSSNKKQQISAIINVDDLRIMQSAVRKTQASEAVLNYLLRLIHESRYGGLSAHPLSPRCSKILLQAAKATAFLQQRDYLIPEDIQAVFVAVTEHRLAGINNAKPGSKTFSQTLLDSVDPFA